MEEEKFKLSCLHEVETQIKEVDCKCDDIVSQLQRVENKISQTKLGILEEDLMKQRGALLGTKQAMEGKNALIRKMQLSLEANRAQLRMLEDELQQVIQLDRYSGSKLRLTFRCFHLINRNLSVNSDWKREQRLSHYMKTYTVRKKCIKT